MLAQCRSRKSPHQPVSKPVSFCTEPRSSAVHVTGMGDQGVVPHSATASFIYTTCSSASTSPFRACHGMQCSTCCTGTAGRNVCGCLHVLPNYATSRTLAVPIGVQPMKLQWLRTLDIGGSSVSQLAASGVQALTGCVGSSDGGLHMPLCLRMF